MNYSMTLTKDYILSLLAEGHNEILSDNTFETTIDGCTIHISLFASIRITRITSTKNIPSLIKLSDYKFLNVRSAHGGFIAYVKIHVYNDELYFNPGNQWIITERIRTRRDGNKGQHIWLDFEPEADNKEYIPIKDSYTYSTGDIPIYVYKDWLNKKSYYIKATDLPILDEKRRELISKYGVEYPHRYSLNEYNWCYYRDTKLKHPDYQIITVDEFHKLYPDGHGWSFSADTKYAMGQAGFDMSGVITDFWDDNILLVHPDYLTPYKFAFTGNFPMADSLREFFNYVVENPEVVRRHLLLRTL